jgi:type VI protein secretion system component Hcp
MVDRLAIVIRAVMVVTALVAAAAPARAQNNLRTLMKVDGVTGDSIDDRHQGWIDLVSYSQTIGTKACARIVALKSLDSASPGLVTYAATNQIIPSVTVEMIKNGKDQYVAFRAILEQVQIGQTELVEQELVAIAEKVVFLPRFVRLSFFPQRADGSPGAPITSVVTCQ